jgi:hypothetical protein
MLRQAASVSFHDLVNCCSVGFKGLSYINRRRRLRELSENSVGKSKEVGLKRFFRPGVKELLLIGKRLRLTDDELD